MILMTFLITGGAFSSGSGDQYGGDYFADEDVVLVFINYRLGPLGNFFDFESINCFSLLPSSDFIL